MSKTAMKLALEALEQYTNVVASVNNPDAWVTVVDAGKPAREAIAALREALAEQPAQQWQSTADKCELQKVPANGSLLTRMMNERVKSNVKQVIELYDSPDQPSQQEPVAWLITDEKINSLQADSIQRLIDRARHAHMTDIKLRINGQDEWYQADWLKHLIRATPPQRTWVGLTGSEITTSPPYSVTRDKGCFHAGALWAEAKLKEKNA